MGCALVARPRVFEPVEIGRLQLRNRLVRSATWEGMADPEGVVTDALVELYRRLATGGVGLIISSYMTVHPQGRQHADQIGAHHDRHRPGLQRLAKAVHAHGGIIIGQLAHCGGQSSRQAMAGLDPLAPSNVHSPGYGEVPRALSLTEIGEIVESFALAAGRLCDAGFDGVQLHGAHGYLLAQFLSPSRNRREDDYGGCLENRARFSLEVYSAVRRRVGADYPILIKLNAHDFLVGSTTEDDAVPVARWLADAGIDAIEVSGGTPGSGKLGAARADIASTEDEAYFLPQARAIRAAAPNTTLILVGGLRSLETMERIVSEGTADLLAMSRPLIREPALPQRWQSGDRSRAACVSCLGCFGPTRRGEGVRCVRRDAPPR